MDSKVEKVMMVIGQRMVKKVGQDGMDVTEEQANLGQRELRACLELMALKEPKERGVKASKVSKVP